jgi:hypothetical protein
LSLIINLGTMLAQVNLGGQRAELEGRRGELMVAVVRQIRRPAVAGNLAPRDDVIVFAHGLVWVGLICVPILSSHSFVADYSHSNIKGLGDIHPLIIDTDENDKSFKNFMKIGKLLNHRVFTRGTFRLTHQIRQMSAKFKR